MPIASPAQDKLNALGFDTVLDMIHDGLAQTEIAQSLGMASSGLNAWLHASPDRSARVKRAMTESAESWLDRGLRAIEQAPSDAAEINRARVLEQHCARRAAIRNPLYRDKVDQVHSGQVELRSITRRIIDTALPMVDEVQPQLDNNAGAHTREGE